MESHHTLSELGIPEILADKLRETLISLNPNAVVSRNFDSRFRTSLEDTRGSPSRMKRLRKQQIHPNVKSYQTHDDSWSSPKNRFHSDNVGEAQRFVCRHDNCTQEFTSLVSLRIHEQGHMHSKNYYELKNRRKIGVQQHEKLAAIHGLMKKAD